MSCGTNPLISTLNTRATPTTTPAYPLLFLAGSCEREEEREFVEIRIEIPVTITPSHATLQLGDTLWIQADFPDTVSDYISKMYLKVPNFSFHTRIFLTKLVSNSLYETEQPAAAQAFNFYFAEGSLTEIGSLGGTLNFVSAGIRYRVKIGLIPKYPGIYGIRFLYGHPIINTTVVPVLDSVNKNRVYVMYFMNYILNDGNFHYELYEANVKTVYDLRTEPDFERIWSMYCFEVL